MKCSEVYLKAAQMVFKSVSSGHSRKTASHTAGCYAIRIVNKSNRSFTVLEAFNTVFARPDRVFWFGRPYYLDKSTNTKRMNHRVFALLLMAELAKDQNL